MSNEITVVAGDEDSLIVLYYQLTSESGCDYRDSVSIEVDDDLQIEIDSDSYICNDLAVVSASVNAPEESIVIEWSTTEDFSTILGTGLESTFTIEGDSEQLYVRVSAPDFTSCSPATASVAVSDILFGTVAEFIDINFCTGDKTSVEITPSRGGLPISIQWDADDHIISDLGENPILVQAQEG